MAADTFLAITGLIGLRLVELFGIDPKAYVQQMGIVPSPGSDTKKRLPSKFVDVGFETALSLIPDPAFALRAAECWHPSNLGVLGYAWLSSGTLRTGLQRFARYSRILGTKAVHQFVDGPAQCHFIFDHRRGNVPYAAAMVDFSLSIVLSMCRTNYGEEFCPDAVTLRRPKPVDVRPYEQFFGCVIHFDAAQDSFVLSRAIVDRPLKTADHELVHVFDVMLSEQLATLGSADIVTRCKNHLLRQLTSGEPSEKELASAMGMSSRTLQRRLGDLGLSYQSVIDATRYDMAQRYLRDARKSVTDITFLLGFSEQSAFSRAFKRWSGRTPTRYRAELLNPA